MKKSSCPFRTCRIGLWFIVREGCSGQIRCDEINGDQKVWFVECLQCKGPAQADTKLQNKVN